MLRLPPEAIQKTVCEQVQRDSQGRVVSIVEVLPSEWLTRGHYEYNPDIVQALNLVADAATRHCLEKVREFLKQDEGVLVSSNVDGSEIYVTTLQRFDSWLSHEGVK